MEDTAIGSLPDASALDGTEYFAVVQDGATKKVQLGTPVESGSNSDGEWTRWADGTQICWNYEEEEINVINPSNIGGYVSNSSRFDFPATFDEPPRLVIGSSRGVFVQEKGDESTVLDSYRVRVRNSDQVTAVTARWNYIATGRWK